MSSSSHKSRWVKEMAHYHNIVCSQVTHHPYNQDIPEDRTLKSNHSRFAQ